MKNEPLPLPLDMDDRVELAAREVLAVIDELGVRWMPIVLGPAVSRLRRALDAAAARRVRERAENR